MEVSTLQFPEGDQQPIFESGTQGFGSSVAPSTVTYVKISKPQVKEQLKDIQDLEKPLEPKAEKTQTVSEVPEELKSELIEKNTDKKLKKSHTEPNTTFVKKKKIGNSRTIFS